MSKIHSKRIPFDDDFHRVNIRIKSKLLCDVLIKYKDALTENLEISIKKDLFTFRDDLASSYIPILPAYIVAGIIEMLGIWSDSDCISYDISEEIINELAANAILISNSVEEMDWEDIYHEWDGESENTSRRALTIHDGCVRSELTDGRIVCKFDSRDLTGDRKLIYELVSKNYMSPNPASVIYKKYATTNSFYSIYNGEQYKNSVIKLLEDEFVDILNSLVEDGYLEMNEDGIVYVK